MSVTPIRLFGDPVLRTPAQPVTTFDKELRRLVADLTDTMMAAPGAGLAAPQLGVSLRVFTYCVDGELGHLVNPDLDLSDDVEEDDESCLSIPGVRVPTPRAYGAVARGWNMHGDPVTVEGTSRKARALQHETDHLDGILFIDRLDGDARRAALRALRETEWFGTGATEVRASPHAETPRWR